MAFTTLNIGQLPPIAPPQAITAPTGQPAIIGEIGATGTPIFGGFLRELGEYNPELTGLEAISIYERMRRSDAQVAATLLAVKLPIRAAEWTIQEPADASPVEKEATQFIHSCLIEELDLDGIVENALLMLDFGCAVHEDVYYVDGNNIRLKKLAARLPLTFYRWLTAPNGDDLVALQQMGYRGQEYLVTEIPASKMALFTYQQEGANYTGRALTRAMYQHWYIKNKLYAIEAIALERNGMGIPWITAGPDAKVEDREVAKEWLAGIAVSEATSLFTPQGWNFRLEGVQGTTMNPKEAIDHHNSMISGAALAQFMNLGQSGRGGARALGQTMSDFFYLSLQSVANQIARVISLSTINRLVDLNFTGIVNYPKLQPQQILSVKIEGVVDALAKLANTGVDLIQPDDDLEEWMRNKMGMPASKNPRVRPAGGAAGGSGGGPEANATFSEVNSAFLPSRPPRGPEKFMALSEISSLLDKGRDQIAAALRAARPRVQAEILHKLVSLPIGKAHKVTVDPDAKLITQILNILQDLQAYGLESVTAERKKQLAGRAPETAQQIRGAAKAASREPLGIYADGVVSEYTNNLQQRAANVILDLKRKQTDTGQMILEANDDLDDQSDGWIDNISAKGANEAFAQGRNDGYEQYKDEIGRVLYSALLDTNTCDQCSSADGEEGDSPDDITNVPNPDCDGGDKCRCVHVYVFDDESEKSA